MSEHEEGTRVAPEGSSLVNWNQAICETCWARRNPAQVPVRVRVQTVETCAYCGYETASGIYVREHPDRVPYPQPDDEQ